MSKTVAMVHHQTHIGGGQTYFNFLKESLTQSGVKVELIENHGTHGRLNKLLLLKRILSTRSPIIVWSIYEGFPLTIYLLAFLLGKKNYLIIYGVWFYENKTQFDEDFSLGQIIHWAFYGLKAFLLQFYFICLSEKLIHLSQYGKKQFFSLKVFKIFKNKRQSIIYGSAKNGIFSKLNITSKLSIRNRLGIKPNDFIILIAGRVERRKNYKDALDILSSLKKQFPSRNIFLYFVMSYGDFNDTIYLNGFFNRSKELNLGSYVRLISSIDNFSMNAFYQMADIFLMLSQESETFGLVTVEALSSGCPVFGYKKCATPEIISYNQDLFLASNKTHLIELIRKYIQLSQKEKNKILNTLPKMIEKFSWKSSINKLLD